MIGRRRTIMLMLMMVIRALTMVTTMMSCVCLR